MLETMDSIIYLIQSIQKHAMIDRSREYANNEREGEREKV
jgi:hypothetical protein